MTRAVYMTIVALAVPLLVAGAAGSAAAKGKSKRKAAETEVDLGLVEVPAEFLAAGWTRGTPRLDKQQRVLDGRKAAVWEEDDQLVAASATWLGVTDPTLTRAILLVQISETLGDSTVFFRYTPTWADVDGDGEQEVVLTLGECQAPCRLPQEVVYQRRFGAMRVVSRDAAKCARTDDGVDWLVAGADAPVDVVNDAWTRALALVKQPARLYCPVWDLAFLHDGYGPAVGSAFQSEKIDDVQVFYYAAAAGQLVRMAWTGKQAYLVDWAPALGLRSSRLRYIGFEPGLGVHGPIALLTVDIETAGAVARWAVLMKLETRAVILSLRLDGPKPRTVRLADDDNDSLSELIVTDSATGDETTYWFDKTRAKWVW